MRKIIIIFTILVGIPSVAQNRSMLLQRINEIKNQSDVFLWDQFTHSDADSAKVYVTKRLLATINRGLEENEKLSVEGIMPFASYIYIDRGKMKQCFAYIRKTDFSTIVNTTMPFVPDAFVQRILLTKDFMSVYRLLQSLQSQGDILQFGKLKDVDDYSSFDLILFDMNSQEVITMLSSETPSGKRINLVNGSEDSLDNYPTKMTAVIWYIQK